MNEHSPPLIALVCHGSRDRRARERFETFVRECQQTLTQWCVVGCQLELAEQSLSQQLQQALLAADRSFAMTDVVVVPVLMAAGVHVREDIPAAIAETESLHPHLLFHMTPPIGQAQQLADILLSFCDAMPYCQPWVLWGHGSRKASFARQFEQIGHVISKRHTSPAKQQVLTAFAKQEPDLDYQVRRLYRAGNCQIGVLTGLLFPGWLSDRLRDTVRNLEAELPQLHLHVSPVLMPHPLWVDAVRELVVNVLEKPHSVDRQAA